MRDTLRVPHVCVCWLSTVAAFIPRLARRVCRAVGRGAPASTVCTRRCSVAAAAWPRRRSSRRDVAQGCWHPRPRRARSCGCATASTRCRRPTSLGRLAALDLMVGRRSVACMGTAAALHGFDTENDPRVHVLDPGIRMRPTDGVMVHQRTGAPLQGVDGRLATAPAWTAVEVARTLRRPRALATLDAALHARGVHGGRPRGRRREQKGRRGIVRVRELLAHADGRAESPMESEARLVFIDGGLPTPELQYEIVDRCGDLWRTDFAWPTRRSSPSTTAWNGTRLPRR